MYDEMKTQEQYFGGTGATQNPAYPRDNIADMILEAVVCYGQLVGKCGAMNFDVNAGAGGVVQVPIIAARSHAQGPYQGCQCLSAASSSISKVTVTVYSWGDYEVMCDFDMWRAVPQLKDAIINEMGKAIAHRFDHQIWWSLCTALVHPGYHVRTNVVCTSTATQGACCIYRFNLYNSIVSLKAAMEANCYQPDIVIMNPTVAKWLKMPLQGDIPAGMITLGADGKLINVAGLKVIEAGTADACSATAGATMAVIIDSKRAIAEAWGKRPTFEEHRDPHCNTYQEVVWAYWGVNRVDLNAIAHVMNA